MESISMNSNKYPISGKCQCGQITYEINKDPLFVGVCHCKECQKLSASAFSMTMLLSHDAINFKGELKIWERPTDSGNINRAFFCSNCGNRIYHINPEHPDVIKLKPGTLDSTSWLQPQAHFWVSQKQHWVTIEDGIDQHETQPW